MSKEPEFIGGKPISPEELQGFKVDTGRFAPEARALAEGSIVDQVIKSTLIELDEVQDIIEGCRALPVYGVKTFNGVTYIKTPAGDPERLELYIRRMEASLIEHHRRLKAVVERAEKAEGFVRRLQEGIASMLQYQYAGKKYPSTKDIKRLGSLVDETQLDGEKK